MSIIIRYTQSVYQNKVNNLMNLHGELQTHLANLEGYRDQIKNFWNDDEGMAYYNLVNTEIRAVKNAMNRVQNLHTIYSDSVDELNSAKTATSGLLEEAGSILSGLGIGDE